MVGSDRRPLSGSLDSEDFQRDMHELSIAVALLDAARAEAEARGASRIVRLTCRIGVARHVEPDMLREAFAVARENTPAAEVDLQVETVGMTLTCNDCGACRHLDTWAFTCPTCGGDHVQLTGGDELELSSLELEVPDD